MHKRVVLQLIKNRSLEPRKFIQVLVSPRQVGKTTLIKQLLSEINVEYYAVTADLCTQSIAFG
jgi:predicted AAA+ superfamily ATPase